MFVLWMINLSERWSERQKIGILSLCISSFWSHAGVLGHLRWKCHLIEHVSCVQASWWMQVAVLLSVVVLDHLDQSLARRLPGGAYCWQAKFTSKWSPGELPVSATRESSSDLGYFLPRCLGPVFWQWCVEDTVAAGRLMGDVVVHFSEKKDFVWLDSASVCKAYLFCLEKKSQKGFCESPYGGLANYGINNFVKGL